LPLQPDQALLARIARRIAELLIQSVLHLISPLTGCTVGILHRLTQVGDAIPLLWFRMLTATEQGGDNNARQYFRNYIN